MLSTTTTTITAASHSPDIVYAKWRGRITNQPLQRDLPSYTDYYDVTIRPELPLAVGRMIKIWTLIETHHTLLDNSAELIPYDSYDSGVGGRITRMRSVEGNTVEFVLENHIKNSVVSLAYISVPYILNVTAKLDTFWRLFQWFTVAKNQPNARFIHLESAVVIHTTTESSRCPARQIGAVEKPTKCSDEKADEKKGASVINVLRRDEWEEDADDDDWEGQDAEH